MQFVTHCYCHKSETCQVVTVCMLYAVSQLLMCVAYDCGYIDADLNDLAVDNQSQLVFGVSVDSVDSIQQ